MHICSRCDESKSVGDAPLAPTIWLGVRPVSFRPESSDRMGQSSSLQHNTTQKNNNIIVGAVYATPFVLLVWISLLLIISNCRIMRHLVLFHFFVFDTFVFLHLVVVAGSGDYCVVVLPFSLVSKIERLTTVAYLPAKEKGKKRPTVPFHPFRRAFMYCN